MPYKFSSTDYDPDKTVRASIPPVGSIVAVRIVGSDETEFDWAGTREKLSQAGNPILQVHAAVESGEPGEGCWLFDYIVLNSEYTGQRVGGLLDALGFDMSAKGYVLDPRMLVGRRGYVKIKHETYKDEPRARIAYWVVPSQYDKHGLRPLAAGVAAGEPETDEPDWRRGTLPPDDADVAGEGVGSGDAVPF